MSSASRHVSAQYDELADRYDVRWKKYLAHSIDETVARLPLAPHDRVLDAGCGTGLLLAHLVASAVPLTLAGVDLSSGMVNVARHRLPASVSLVKGDVTAMPFDDASFDVIVSSSSFHYWPDHRVALDEFRRLLAPDGRLVITDWCRDYLACTLLDMLLRRVDPAHRRTWSSTEFREIIESSGFQVQYLDRYRVSWLWGLMTVGAAPRSR